MLSYFIPLSLALSVVAMTLPCSYGLTVSWGNDLTSNVLQDSSETPRGANFKFEPGIGEKLYRWVHNGTVLGGSDATQAALITATSWNIPDCKTHTLPFVIDLQNATTAVLGSNTVKAVDLQMAAVPEHSTALLLLTDAGGLAFRHRCKRGVDLSHQ